VILLGSGFALAIALIGWVGYSLLAPVATANPGELFAVREFSPIWARAQPRRAASRHR